MHALLSFSSLLFHVLAKRIRSNPLVIWNEYRLHAIVFSLRCISVAIFGFYRPYKDTNYENILLFMLVMCHHVVVDQISLV